MTASQHTRIDVAPEPRSTGIVELAPVDLDDSHIGLWVRVLGGEERAGYLRGITPRLIRGEGLVIDLEIGDDGEVSTPLQLKRYSTWPGARSEAEARTVLVYPVVCAHCDDPIALTVVRTTRTRQIRGWVHVRLAVGHNQQCAAGGTTAEPGAGL